MLETLSINLQTKAFPKAFKLADIHRLAQNQQLAAQMFKKVTRTPSPMAQSSAVLWSTPNSDLQICVFEGGIFSPKSVAAEGQEPHFFYCTQTAFLHKYISKI